MSDLSAKRTPQVIAAEINMIISQTKKILLAGAIEIGRRLKEAKGLVKHGEWLKWLEESVSYSQRTASRLIKIYEEYGPYFGDGADDANRSPVTDLTYTQAVLLLGLPGEEREEFLAQNNVPAMSKQELQQALKHRSRDKESNKQAKILTHNLKTQRDPDAHLKYVEQCDSCCQTLADTFFSLTTALTNLAYIDAELKEEKRKEAEHLVKYMAETIKQWPPPRKPLRVSS